MSDNFENKENEELLGSETEENIEETATDAAEDVVEEAMEKAVGEAELADAAGAVLEEGIREDVDVSGVEEASEPSVEYAVAESGIEDIPVKGHKGAVIAVIIALVVALLAGAGALVFFIGRAPYNYMGYINVSGRTVQDIADMQGGTLEEFLDAYSLPADMPGSTDEAAAYYTIPTGVIAEMYGMDFAMLKETLKLPDTVSDIPLKIKFLDLISSKLNIGTTIDENTPWGITEGEAPLGTYVGEENLDEFKKEYGLGDEITADTKWKEVRNIVDTASLAKRVEAEKAQEDAAVKGSDDSTVSTEAAPESNADTAANGAADAAPAAENNQ